MCVTCRTCGRVLTDGAEMGDNVKKKPGERFSRKLNPFFRLPVRKTGPGIGAARDYYDYNLLAAVILLTCFGLVMLYSTSAYEASVNYQDDMYFFGKQAAISAFSVILMITLSTWDYHWFAGISPLVYGVSMVLLFITRFVGTTVNGARRWIRVGPISFQTAELAKLAVILTLSSYIFSRSDELDGRKVPIVVTVLGGIAAILTFVFTENLSTALIIAGISFILIFIVSPKTKVFLGIMGVGMVSILLAVFLIIPRIQTNPQDFRLRRIQVWINPEEYSDAGGYQVMQGLYAIGSGGLFGKGLGNSTQKLESLPEAQNDMIFCIICEELGVFGAAVVLLLFVFLLYRLFFIARNAPDLLGSLIASGIFVHISLQVVLNIAVVTNVIPTTGITLPFVSYGGTSILFLMAEMMLALSISRQIRLR